MAQTRMAALMTRLGLEVNETKTRLARIPEDNITFLGYTLGRFYGKAGRPYVGMRPSRKAVKSLLKRIHEQTTRRWYADTPRDTVADLSRLLRGWCGYFDQGLVMETYNLIREYVNRRLRHWLVRRTGDYGHGFERLTAGISARHARALPHSEAPRRPAESENLMGRVKSWMPEIGTSSFMSGDWKRGYGANCDTGTGESCRQQ